MAGRRRNVNIGANAIVYSGRGRPRTKEVEERPLPVGIVLSPGSPCDLYKNRKIRVGGAFQAKVPKVPEFPGGGTGDAVENNGYRNRRPPPFRVSMEHPHLTEQEVTNYEREISQQKGKPQNDSHISQQGGEGRTFLAEGSSPMDMDIDLSAPMEVTAPVDSSNSLNSNLTGSQKTFTTLSTTDRLQQQQNQQSEEGSTKDDNDDVEEEASDNDNEDEQQELNTKRGGLLIHPVSCSTSTSTAALTTSRTESSDFWDFLEPLVLPYPAFKNESTTISAASATTGSSTMTTAPSTTASNNANSSAETWQSKIYQWNLDRQYRQQVQDEKAREELAQKNLPKRRGRKPKRKKEVTPELLDEEINVCDWYTSNIINSGEEEGQLDSFNKNNSNKRRRMLVGTEEEQAHAMQQVWLRQKGVGPLSKLKVLVQLSAGKAEFTQRVRENKRRKEEKKCEQQQESRYGESVPPLSWRQHIEQSVIMSMTGDFRDLSFNRSVSYPFSTNNSDGKVHNEIAMSDATDIEVQREVWKSILVFGKAIQEHLEKASKGSDGGLPFPKLSLLLSFLNNAYEVRPAPEDIFRSSALLSDINACMNSIMEHVMIARKLHAQVLDMLYETSHGGVDLEALQKLLDQNCRSLPIELDGFEHLYEEVTVAADWQKRLDALLGDGEPLLNSLEELAQDGRASVFRTKSLVHLENRIHRAYALRSRIEEWRKNCLQNEENLEDKKESVKFLGAMVRDANRLKLAFPEVSELITTHKAVEAWIDRASIAVRSKISLVEIKTLVATGEEMPVDLSDLMDKLCARISAGEEWIGHFREFVPCPQPYPPAPDQSLDATLLAWMEQMRKALKDGKYTVLHDLASEGSRIPVEVDIVKLLQMELDGKNWTSKVKKWVPELAQEEENINCKRAKLEDLREHIFKADVLREKLPLSSAAKEQWFMEGEKEIRAIVDAADEWFQKYKPYLDWDNRRTEGRCCLSMKTLKSIVDEGNSIYANLGPGTGKMARILSQAEVWAKAHDRVLRRCQIFTNGEKQLPQEHYYVTIQEMAAAAQAASSDVSLDLSEAKQVEALMRRIQDWSNRVNDAAPKRSKRQGRGRKAKCTVDDMIKLIDEASDLPVDLTDDVNRVQVHLSEVQEWRSRARQDLENIQAGFQKLRQAVDGMYGAPTEYSRNKNDESETNEDSDDVMADYNSRESDTNEEKKSMEDASNCDTSSVAMSDQDNEDIGRLGNGNCNVNQLIKMYRREAKSIGVISGEVEAADKLDRICTWCVRSLKYLVTQRDIFDKRFFGAFDRFVAEGRELLATPKDDATDANIRLDDQEFSCRLNESWAAFVSDQLRRLDILLVDREQFLSWCNSSEALFSGEKCPPLEKLKEIADSSRVFPSVCDMVQKVRGIYNKALAWKESTSKIINGDERLTRHDIKCVIDQGEKLGFLTEELKLLRSAERAAKNWANRAKRCKTEQGSTNATAVQALIREHSKLLVEMPEELARLQQAMKNYCLCRRPYSGFMIGCDECEEWYHGSCIGITESKADKVDKFLCVRCCVSRLYKNTAKETAGIIRKWTNQKDLKKARQVETQKHQRKVRKENKDIEKLRRQITAIQDQLAGRATQLQTNAQQNTTGLNKGANQPTSGDNSQNQLHAGQVNQIQPDEGLVVVSNGQVEGSVDPKPPPQPTTETLSPEEAHAKIEKALKQIDVCSERLRVLSKRAEQQKEVILMEDSKAHLLRCWCLRVRSLVLFPRSDEDAKACRPLYNGSLSAAMHEVISEAERLEIICVADVEAIINSFRCMSWCLLAASILARRPSLNEIASLVSLGNVIKFSEEKAIRTIKGILSRAKTWQNRVLKTLAPVPGEKRPFSLDTLKELEATAADIPLTLREESLLQGVIEDNGSRHCLCGGPSDARFMLSCDKCDDWFHGPCVNMMKEECDSIQKWICPPCSGTPKSVDASLCGIVWDDHDTVHEHDVSPVALDASTMWPPFGLCNSSAALEILGAECSAIPDLRTDEINSLFRIVEQNKKEKKSADVVEALQSLQSIAASNTEQLPETSSTSVVPGMSLDTASKCSQLIASHATSASVLSDVSVGKTQVVSTGQDTTSNVASSTSGNWLPRPDDLQGLNTAALAAAAAAAAQVNFDPVQAFQWQQSTVLAAAQGISQETTPATHNTVSSQQLISTACVETKEEETLTATEPEELLSISDNSFGGLISINKTSPSQTTEQAQTSQSTILPQLALPRESLSETTVERNDVKAITNSVVQQLPCHSDSTNVLNGTLSSQQPTGVGNDVSDSSSKMIQKPRYAYSTTNIQKTAPFVQQLISDTNVDSNATAGVGQGLEQPSCSESCLGSDDIFQAASTSDMNSGESAAMASQAVVEASPSVLPVAASPQKPPEADVVSNQLSDPTSHTVEESGASLGNQFVGEIPPQEAQNPNVKNEEILALAHEASDRPPACPLPVASSMNITSSTADVAASAVSNIQDVYTEETMGVDSTQSELHEDSTQLNPSSVPLLMAALPVQDSGS